MAGAIVLWHRRAVLGGRVMLFAPVSHTHCFMEYWQPSFHLLCFLWPYDPLMTVKLSPREPLVTPSQKIQAIWLNLHRIHIKGCHRVSLFYFGVFSIISVQSKTRLSSVKNPLFHRNEYFYHLVRLERALFSDHFESWNQGTRDALCTLLKCSDIVNCYVLVI